MSKIVAELCKSTTGRWMLFHIEDDPELIQRHVRRYRDDMLKGEFRFAPLNSAVRVGAGIQYDRKEMDLLLSETIA